jgi:hypothetical protein
VFEGLGTGAFLPLGSLASLPQQTALEVTHIDEDDRLDLLVVRRFGSRASVLVGDGAGGFAPFGELATPGQPVGIAAGRLDGDARADLVVTCAATDSVAVFRTESEGSFTRTQAFRAGRLLGRPALFDFDGSGTLDLAYVEVGASGPAGSLVVHGGLGDGTFGPAMATPAGEVPAAVRFARLDGDEAVDAVVVSTSRRALRIFWGRGDGTFVAGPADTLPVTNAEFVLADLDRDAAVDFLIADAQGHEVLVRPGLPGGTFGPPWILDAGLEPTSLHVADANADGRDDLLALRGGAEPLVTILQGARFPNVALRSFRVESGTSGVRLFWSAAVASAGVWLRAERSAGFKEGWDDVGAAVPASTGLVTGEIVDTDTLAPGVYRYRLRADVDGIGTSVFDEVPFSIASPAIEIHASPIPARGSVAIRFALPGGGAPIDLEIFDPSGRRVRTLANGDLPAGEHVVTWEGTTTTDHELPSGVYFVRLASRGLSQTLRVLLVR